MVVRDFRRNPAVTVTLVALLALSVLLASASAGLLARLGGAADMLLSDAQAPHVAQMHTGTVDPAALEAWVATRDDIVAHQDMFLLSIDGANLAFAGENQAGNIQQNSLVVPAAERDLLLLDNNEPLTTVDPGTIWLPVIYRIENGLAPGDTVTVTGPDGFSRELTVAGFVRDSIMNTAIASSKRLAVSSTDHAAIAERTGTEEHLIAFWLTDPGQAGAFAKAYQDSGLPRLGPLVDSSTFRLFNMISEGLIAGVVILAAALLMVVGLLCLRLSLVTAGQQDLREISVLSAIGVAPRDIKRIYLAKYGAIAGVAALFGLAGGLALIPVLSRSLTAYMGDVPSVSAWVAPVLTAAAVFGVVLLFIWLMLRRLDRISAVEGLRAGAAGGFSRPSRLRLHRSRRTPTNVRLGWMDLSRQARTYVLLFLAFVVSAFIVLMPVNAATTIRAPEFITYMGIGQADVRLDIQHSGPESTRQFEESVAAVESSEDVAAVVALTTTRREVPDGEGVPVSLYVESGDHARLPLSYAHGRAPRNEREIALSLLALNETGRSVGDTVPVTGAAGVRELTIVGSYQDITNGGKTAKATLPVAGEEVMWHVVAIDLNPGVDTGATAERLGQRWPLVRASEIQSYRDQQLGPIATQLGQVALLCAFGAVLLAVLMTAMFTRMLLAGDAREIAIQRAVGASDAGIRLQYLTRIITVLVVGVPVGVLAATTVGEGLFNVMFEAVYGGQLLAGTSRIRFLTEPWLTWAALPAAMIVAVGLATWVSCRSVRDVSIRSVSGE